MTLNIIQLFAINFLNIFAVSSSSASVVIVEPPQDYEVVYVSAVFRHGDRTPEDLYPNDPITEDDLYPIGFGGLTLAGKSRAYELGSQLRYLYKDLLGETYMPYMVNARSTNIERTKMSLMLVLSALYPPRGKQIWNPILNWQPIPYSYASVTQDFLLAIASCPLYLQELKRVQNSEEITVKVEKYRPLMINLTQWTGKTINSSTDLLLLYHTLMAEYSMGFKLPEWTHDIVPNGLLRDATILRLQILNYNIKLRRLYSGVLLNNIIHNMKGIANGTIRDGRKINLFSAHDTNIASFLIALGVFEPHVPEYSSCINVELLRNRDNQYYVGIRYYLGIPPETRILQIPGCDMSPCPLGQFVDLMANVTSSEEDAMCPH